MGWGWLVELRRLACIFNQPAARAVSGPALGQAYLAPQACMHAWETIPPPPGPLGTDLLAGCHTSGRIWASCTFAGSWPRPLRGCTLSTSVQWGWLGGRSASGGMRGYADSCGSIPSRLPSAVGLAGGPPCHRRRVMSSERRAATRPCHPCIHPWTPLRCDAAAVPSRHQAQQLSLQQDDRRHCSGLPWRRGRRYV